MTFESETASNELTDTQAPLTNTNSQLDVATSLLAKLKETVKNLVKGRDEVIELCIIALVADGHILLEDFPGSGKTTLAKALGEAITSNHDQAQFAAFRRIQFTPDLLPSDVTGSPVFDADSGKFHFRHGPVFAHVVLADEINRTSPKVQAAMLEAMGEKQVTVDNTTYHLDELFFVIATQNPLDLVGTYPLPTPQLDRFLFKITMDHIDRESELEVLDTYRDRRDGGIGNSTITREELLKCRSIIDECVTVSDAVKKSLVDISIQIREDDRVLQGNSTRSLVLLLPALQVSAALRGRNYVSSEDIEFLLQRVLEHRVELAPGVNDFGKLLKELMQGPMEELARSTLS